MKPALLLALALSLSGCASIGTGDKSPIALVNQLFDATLPKTFNGPVDISHNNPYIKLRIKAGGVKWTEAAGWQFDWLDYQRSGLSSGSIVLGKLPQ